MFADVLRSRIIGRHRRGQNEICLALTHCIGSALALTGFESAIGYLGKTESLAVEKGRLARVADPEFDVMNVFEFEWIFHLSPQNDILALNYYGVAERLRRNGALDEHFVGRHVMQPVTPLTGSSIFRTIKSAADLSSHWTGRAAPD